MGSINLYLLITVGIIFVYFYFVVSQFFAYRKFNYLQQTNVAIIIGVLAGAIIFSSTSIFNANLLDIIWMKDVIFLVLLPPIMLQDGYNFPKRKFFQNLFYINLFGVVGTFLNFIILYYLLAAFNNIGVYKSISDNQTLIPYHNWQFLLTAACLCSVQPIVSEKIINKERYPKLFSIIFGESLNKDTITITIFTSILLMINKYGNQNIDVDGNDVGLLILRFIVVVLGSLFIGIVCGLITTLFFKNFRFLIVQVGLSQIALTILTGYFSYIISEWLQFSGVISMLFCGTVLSHFNSYNMTQFGKESAIVTICVLKVIASGLIYFLLGFFTFNIQNFNNDLGVGKSSFSLNFLLITFACIFIARFVNVFVMSGIGYLILGRQKWRLNIYEIIIIYGAGLIKGAVPFALIMTIPFSSTSSSNSIQSNIIFIVLITSLIFNTFMPKFQKLMLKQISKLRKEDPQHPSLRDSLILKQGPNGQSNIASEAKVYGISGRMKSTTQKYWRKFEEGCLKPFLIFNYHERKDQIKLEKMKQRKKEYEEYMSRYGELIEENILNLQNEQENKFIDLKLSNGGTSSDSDSDTQKEERVITVKKKAQGQIKHRPSEQEITNLKKPSNLNMSNQPTKKQ